MVAIPSHLDILEKCYAILSTDAALVALLGGTIPANPKIYNHLPQDLPLPAMRLRWTEVNEWDTKDSAGYQGSFIIDSWCSGATKGDKLLLQICDRVEILLHETILPMTTGQSLLLRHERPLRIMVEPDGITHHAVQQFVHIATT